MAKIRISMAVKGIGVIGLIAVADSFQDLCNRLCVPGGHVDGMSPETHAFGRWKWDDMAGVFEFKEPPSIQPVKSPIIVPAR